MTPEENFAQLGLTLPPAPGAKAVYKPLLIDGKYCYVSGHGPYLNDGTTITGKVGAGHLSDDEAKNAAQQVGLAILATLQTGLGSLNKVKRVIKVLGLVNALPDYENHPYVINGCSELFAKVWGNDNGIGVRSAMGMGSLPGNIAVEIEALFELE
jgi:hypothetical protein